MQLVQFIIINNTIRLSVNNQHMLWLHCCLSVWSEQGQYWRYEPRKLSGSWWCARICGLFSQFSSAFSVKNMFKSVSLLGSIILLVSYHAGQNKYKSVSLLVVSRLLVGWFSCKPKVLCNMDILSRSFIDIQVQILLFQWFCKSFRGIDFECGMHSQ